VEFAHIEFRPELLGGIRGNRIQARLSCTRAPHPRHHAM
jgi:hypothetical protein